MEKLEQIEDEMFESMELMLQAYELFNTVLKRGNAVDKAMACCLMDSLSKGFKIEVGTKEDKIMNLQEASEKRETITPDEKKRLDKRMQAFANQTEELEAMMHMTEKALQKYFPLNNRAQAFKKKRNRLRKMRSRKIRD